MCLHKEQTCLVKYLYISFILFDFFLALAASSISHPTARSHVAKPLDDFSHKINHLKIL